MQVTTRDPLMTRVYFITRHGNPKDCYQLRAKFDAGFYFSNLRFPAKRLFTFLFVVYSTSNESADMPKTRKRLDLNTCTVDELESVDGVTRSLAKRIVAYRSRAGYFNNISELGKVRGVGDRTLSIISERVYILPSPLRSRRSSLASSRANSPQRRRSRRNASRVSFSSSPSPIRRKSPKREVALPIRRSERVLSRSTLSRGSSRNSSHHTSPKRQASKQYRSTKKNSKSRFRSGPVFVDSAQNVSIDIGKLAKEGCTLTLHNGAIDGQLCHLMTINVKELDGPGPSVGLSIPTPGRAITEQQRSSSPERLSRASSVVDENVREYLVMRETKRATENFFEEPGTAEEVPRLTTKKCSGLSQKKISPRKDQKNWNRSGDNRRRSRSRSRSRTLTRSVSRSASPQKGSLRRSRSRSGSRKHSQPRSRRRNESNANEHLSRSDIENWLQEGSAAPRIDRGGF